MLKKLMVILCIVTILCTSIAYAAPNTLSSGTTGNSNNLIVITNPPTDKSATFDMSYIISGYGRQGASVTIYFYDNGVYKKSMYDWKIGASGLFFKKITLAKGKNAIICYAESGKANQAVPLEITYLGSNFMGALNNAKISVTQLPTK